MADSDHSRHLRPSSTATYQIEVEGLLQDGWFDYFVGMHISTRSRVDQSVVTCLTGLVMDQSELTGILNALAEFHLPILSVMTIEKAAYKNS